MVHPFLVGLPEVPALNNQMATVILEIKNNNLLYDASRSQ
jgi:hypothetical protein